MSNEQIDEKDSVKKRKSRIETEQKILDAALAVFSELGYEAASIQTIAARANVNSALIIRYFGSKSALLQAIMLEGCKGSFSKYACDPPAETLEAEILRYFMFEIQNDFDHQPFLRLVMQRAILDPEIQQLLGTMIASGGREDLAQCLKPFQRRGDIPQEMNLLELSQVFHDYAFGFGVHVHVLPSCDRKQLEKRARVAARILADGLISAAKSHSNS